MSNGRRGKAGEAKKGRFLAWLRSFCRKCKQVKKKLVFGLEFVFGNTFATPTHAITAATKLFMKDATSGYSSEIMVPLSTLSANRTITIPNATITLNAAGDYLVLR